MNDYVLIVDDETDCLRLLEGSLKTAGYSVVKATNGADALAELRRHLPALIVLDWMLPDFSGIEICKMVKASSVTAGTPIIILTAKAAEGDRITGLEAGADDYVTKPFSPRELQLRVKSQLRRSRVGAAPDHIINLAGIALNMTRHAVTVKGKPVQLTPIEYKLLTILMERPGRVMNRGGLLKEVWGYGVPVASRTVDIRILRLREKLENAGNAIETVRGFGYRFVSQQAE